MAKVQKLTTTAREIRNLVVDISFEAGVGHIGSAFSIIDLLTILYFDTLKIKPKKPDWPKRDRLILSKGHAASGLFATLYKRGYFSKEVLNSYCQNGGKLEVHPEVRVQGVDATSGSLGHGLSLGIGMALGAKKDDLDYRTFVIISDGDCDEGSTWEAALAAGQFKLDNLVAVVDYNKFQAFGRTKQVMDLEPLGKKWEAFGWEVKEVDGHNLKDLKSILTKTPFRKNKPSLLIAHTIIGKGLSFFEDRQEAHYNSLTKEQYLQAKKELA